MRTSLVIAAALLLAVTATAALPAADARAICVWKVDGACPGLVCQYNQTSRTWTCYEDAIRIDCVTEPCPCTCPPTEELWTG